MTRIMTPEMIRELQLHIGDEVQVVVNEPGITQVGDIATLTRRDEDGDWWGVIEDRRNDVCLTDVGVIERMP